MENRKHICAECSHWDVGDFWFGSDGEHGVAIETKGWCLLKPNKRKRWNYHPVCDCFNRKPVTGFIYQGGCKPVEEDIKGLAEAMREFCEDNMENNGNIEKHD